MAITARSLTPQSLLVDFGKPITLVGGTPVFLINGSPSVSVTPGDSDNLLVIGLASALAGGESWLEYVPAPLRVSPAPPAPTILTTVGTPTVVSGFEVLIFETSVASPNTYSAINTSATPTLGDFIEAYGLREAIEISNSQDSAATQPDEIRVMRAIEDAESLWNSELVNAPLANLLVINPGKRRTLLTIARYYLDVNCPRKHVIDAYNEVIRNIRLASSQVSVPILPPGVEGYTGADDFEFYYNEGCPDRCCDCC